jgi:heme/copper-type cytochrome/quinol oxidase subunit 2
MRNVFLLVALLFCLGFAGMTAAVAAQSSFDIFTVVSLVIVVMLGIAVLGALRNPPDD